MFLGVIASFLWMIAILAKTKNSWKKTLSLELEGGWGSGGTGNDDDDDDKVWSVPGQPSSFGTLWLKRNWQARTFREFRLAVEEVPMRCKSWGVMILLGANHSLVMLGKQTKPRIVFERYGLWPCLFGLWNFVPCPSFPFLSLVSFSFVSVSLCPFSSLSLSLSLSLSRARAFFLSFVRAGSVVLQTAAIAVSTSRCSNFAKPAHNRLLLLLFILLHCVFVVEGKENSVTASFCDHNSGFCGVLTSVWVLWRFFRLFFPSLW